jgi:hypothetical protein
VVDHLRIRRLWNCAREGSIPSWFSSTLLVLTGATLFAVYVLAKRRGAKRPTRWGWFCIATFFVFMGVDDAAEIHERIGTWLGSLFREDTSGHPALIRRIMELPAYSWQIFLGPLFAIMGIFMLVFLWNHFGRHGLRRYLLLGLGCYAAAIGFDALERIEGVFESVGDAWDWRTYTVRHNSKVVEELLEMFGTACFWTGALRHFVSEAEGLRFAFVPRPRP